MIIMGAGCIRRIQLAPVIFEIIAINIVWQYASISELVLALFDYGDWSSDVETGIGGSDCVLYE